VSRRRACKILIWGANRRAASHTVAIAVALLAGAWIDAPAKAFSGGITSASMTAGPATCTGPGCHGTASELVEVQWLGPSTLETGETALYELRMIELVEGGLQVGTGINTSMFLDGEALPFPESLEDDPDFPENLQVLAGEITHARNVNVPPGGIGIFSYSFPVTAPGQEGSLELMGALNSFNQNFNSTDDRWQRAELQIQVVPEPVGPVPLLAISLPLGMLAARRAALRQTRAGRWGLQSH